MNSTAALDKIYHILKKPLGKKIARQAVTNCLYLAISRLEDDQKLVNEKNISEILNQFAEDYEYASQKNAV